MQKCVQEGLGSSNFTDTNQKQRVTALLLYNSKCNSIILLTIGNVPTNGVHLLRRMILINLQVFINFLILNIICGPVTIIYLSRVPVHIHIKCVSEYSPNNKNTIAYCTYQPIR
jgi:hypothetical protein